jgi:hypothetical protein
VTGARSLRRSGAAFARAIPPGLRFAGVLLLGITLVAGCGKRKNALVGNIPPETTLFVQDDTLATVNHRVHIYWFGSDPDGRVARFEYRFVNPAELEDTVKYVRLDCLRPGDCNDRLFTIFTGDSAVVARRFDVRAVDDKGLADPSPARQWFTLSNQAPVVLFTNGYALQDTTFPSAAVDWTVDDKDGGGPGLHFRVYLDGHESSYDSTEAFTFTVPSDRFLQGGTYRSGYRTLSVQAVDDGGRLGPPTTIRWYVRAPADSLRAGTNKGRLLLIDDSAVNSVNNFSVDTLYANTLARGDDPGATGNNRLPRGSYSFLRLNGGIPFRNATDFAQTLSLFEAVAWYRGYDTSISTLLQGYEDVVESYVQNGGRLYLEGPYLIAGQKSRGTLREDFVTRFLNCARLYKQYNANFADSTVGLGNSSTGRMRSSRYGGLLARFGDIVPTIQGEGPGLRGFVPNDTTQVALWAMPGCLNPANVEEVPVAMTVPQAGTGRVTLVSFPVRLLAAGTGFTRSWQVLAKFLFDPANGLILP